MSRIETIAEGVTLYLGDCREVLPTLGEVDAVVTDPPYEVTPTSITHYNKPGMIRGWMSESYPVGSGKMFEVPHIDTWARVIFDACAESADCYVMTNDRNLPEFATSLYAAGWKHHNLLVWRKPTGIPNRWYFKNAEFTLYLFKGKAETIATPASTTVFDCPHTEDRVHPSEKPVALFEHYILNSTTYGQTVLDPFMGSGTAGVAAVRHGRKFIGIEIDQSHFDMSCKRVTEATKRPDLFAKIDQRATEIQESWADMWDRPFYKDAAE